MFVLADCNLPAFPLHCSEPSSCGKKLSRGVCVCVEENKVSLGLKKFDGFLCVGSFLLRGTQGVTGTQLLSFHWGELVHESTGRADSGLAGRSWTAPLGRAAPAPRTARRCATAPHCPVPGVPSPCITPGGTGASVALDADPQFSGSRHWERDLA